MAKRQYGNPMRKGMNPALAQISQEKYLEKKLKETYERGMRDGAANAVVAATILFDAMSTEMCDEHANDKFYNNMKRLVLDGVTDEMNIADMIGLMKARLDSINMTYEDLIAIDPALSGRVPADTSTKPAPNIGSKNGITVPAPAEE